MSNEAMHKHHRRSIRLKEHDYASEGGYFVTLVAHKRQHLFGEVVDGRMRLTTFGRIAREEWFETQRLRPNVELLEDEFVVMPNHIHGIIWLHEEEKLMEQYGTGNLQEVNHNLFQNPHTLEGDCKGTARSNNLIDIVGTGDLQVARTINKSHFTQPKGPPSKSIGAIIAGYKAAVTTRINALRHVRGEPVWLRNYYEHIICTEKEYENIANYIYDNPANWGIKDEYFS